MHRMIAFIKKEFRHILRDRRTLMILFGMPVAQVLLFGFVLSNEIKNAAIAVYDPAQDASSIELTNKLISSGYFRLEEQLQSAAGLEPAFRRGSIKLAVVFPPEFGNRLTRDKLATIQIIGDASDPNTATTLINYAQAIILDYQAEHNRGGQPALVQVQSRMVYNPEQKAVFNFVPGVMTLILMLVSAMMTSITLAREKELGTMEVLLVSPLKPVQIILGKTSPYLVLSFVNAVVVVLLGIFVFEMPMRGSILLLGLACLLYMFVSLALGILISTRTDNQMTAMIISGLGLLMPTMLLSGFIFPRESMPWILQMIGNVIPATWFNPVIKGIMIKGAGLSMLSVQLGVLAFMAVFFTALSVRNFKDRL